MLTSANSTKERKTGPDNQDAEHSGGKHNITLDVPLDCQTGDCEHDQRPVKKQQNFV